MDAARNLCIVKGCRNERVETPLVKSELCSSCYVMMVTGEIGHGTTFIHMLKESVRRAQCEGAS